MSHLDAADFYRSLHTGNPGDGSFYCRVAEGASTILDLGCGWGRIARPLLEAGYALTGVDTSSEFIREAKLALSAFPLAHFLEADIRNFTLNDESPPGGFDRIFIAYNTLYSLGGTPGVTACLSRAARYLSKAGELWFDVYPMDELQNALESGEYPPEDDDEPVALFSLGSDQVRVYENTQIDHKAQRLLVDYRAQSSEQKTMGTLKMEHDYLTQAQISESLARAKLTTIGSFGSFNGAPLDEDAEQVIIGAGHAPNV